MPGLHAHHDRAGAQLGIPCRYVSGYLFHQADGDVRSPDGSTHAWGEAWFPDLGWVGFDPTNNLVADDRHIRVAVGRDYADVPPTRGVFKGSTAVRSELSVAVRVGATGQGQTMVAHEVPTHMPWVSREVPSSLPRPDSSQSQQQQQQTCCSHRLTAIHEITMARWARCLGSCVDRPDPSSHLTCVSAAS